MTDRLYYHDSYLRHFSASVVERLHWEGKPAVVLDKTAFYPTSGGQPSDHGTLGEVDVLDVVVREDDGTIVHVLRDFLSAGSVEGNVDWQRRFDHMQQHTGQHILSAAFERLLNADTVGFHLGTKVSTVDIAVPSLDMNDVAPVEGLANQIIWDNHTVSAYLVDREDVVSLNLRREPTIHGPIRLIDIQDFDLNPCGGTHVSRTGEVGLIKTTRLETRGNITRVEFLCGRRALADYRLKNDILANLAQKLTVGFWELVQAVSRLESDGKQARKELRRAREELLSLESERLVQSVVNVAGYSVVRCVWSEREVAEIRTLAQTLARSTGVVALLACVNDDRSHLCFSRAANLDLDVALLLKEACQQLDGKGGGQPHLAQGSTQLHDIARIEAVFSNVISALSE